MIEMKIRSGLGRRWVTLVFMVVLLAANSPYAESIDDLDYKLGLEVFSLGEFIQQNSSILNLDNRGFFTPQWKGDFDFRPSAKLSFRQFKLIAEPRYQLQPQLVPHPWSADEFQWRKRFSLTQLYGLWDISDSLTFSAGVQNFQWGPAELMTPSNPLIHFDPRQRSLFWVEKGRGIVKLNYTQGENWNFITLTEIFDNKIPAWNERTDARFQALAKIEYQRSGADYLGFVGGKGQKSRAWIGQYGSLSLTDGFSVYVDARESIGSDAFYPNLSGLVTTMEQNRAESSRPEILSDLGFRYEGSIDWRSEFLLNTFGLDQHEFAGLLSTAFRPGPESIDDARRALHPGLELPGKYYFYQSMRKADFGPGKRITFLERYLHSFMDHSGVAYLSVETNINDWAVGLLELSIPHGDATSEFKLSQGISIEAGFRLAI